MVVDGAARPSAFEGMTAVTEIPAGSFNANVNANTRR